MVREMWSRRSSSSSRKTFVRKRREVHLNRKASIGKLASVEEEEGRSSESLAEALQKSGGKRRLRDCSGEFFRPEKDVGFFIPSLLCLKSVHCPSPRWLSRALPLLSPSLEAKKTAGRRALNSSKSNASRSLSPLPRSNYPSVSHFPPPAGGGRAREGEGERPLARDFLSAKKKRAGVALARSGWLLPWAKK